MRDQATASMCKAPSRAHRRGVRWLNLSLCAGCVGLAALAWGCSENQSKADPAKRMTFSSGEFNRGYKDGQRDAKWSLSDMSGGWMWLWMTEQEYQKGYEQGWRDGREAVKLDEKRKQQEGESRNLRPAEKESSG